MPDTLDPTASGQSWGERRTVPRYSLIATAEVIEPPSDARMSGRISEISRKGCYLDILNTLPVGTTVQLRVTRDQGSFATMARIIYVQEGIGMGLAFVDPPEDQLRILDSWIAELET
ncbi:MAG: PilZ domain-containing protein [Candidatus Acidiferrales bacterium]